MKIIAVTLCFFASSWSSAFLANAIKKTIEVELVLDKGNAVTVIEEDQENNLKEILKKRFGILDCPNIRITKTPERTIRVLLQDQSYQSCMQSVTTGNFQYVPKPK